MGLEEVDDGVYDLYFCFYQIGRYELRSNIIHDIVSKVGLSRRQVDQFLGVRSGLFRGVFEGRKFSL